MLVRSAVPEEGELRRKGNVCMSEDLQALAEMHQRGSGDTNENGS